MYGIFPYFWLIFMINVAIYTIHWVSAMIMVAWKGGGFLQYDRFLSFRVVFHFHDCGRESGLEDTPKKIWKA